MTYSVIHKYDPKYPNQIIDVGMGFLNFVPDNEVMTMFNNFAYKLKKYEGKQIEWITDKHFKCNGIDYKIEPYKN